MNRQELIDFVTHEKALWESGKIKAPVHLCGGNEDQLIEIFKEIKPYDYVLSSHRNSYHALLHGVEASTLMGEILGQSQLPEDSSPLCKGRARSMGFISHRHRFYSSAIVGGCVNIAVGVAWALKRSNADELRIDEMAAPPRRVWCFVGDGALDGGHFWEALQYACAYDLPIRFVIEDNNRATCTSIEDRLGTGHLSLNWPYWKGMVTIYNYEPTWPHVGSGTYIQF